MEAEPEYPSAVINEVNPSVGVAPGNGVSRRRSRPALIRLVYLVLLATCIGWGLNRIGRTLERRPEPAGFGRGLIQGALMPMALPNLLVGSDVIIYSDRNDGVPYKLGYTLGVNACGAFFFGLLYFRISRWRAAA